VPNKIERTYLDHAATGWPKPPGVLDAAIHYQTHCGVSVGRGSYQSSQFAARLLSSTRQQIANLIGAESLDEVAFTFNGTHALVAGLYGVLRPNDHVVTTRAEHNSVLRPLACLAQARQIEWTAARCDHHGIVDVDELKRSCNARTRWIVLTHASNVTGAIQPVQEVARFAMDRGIRVFVDAAQTLGYCSINVREIGIDMLAFPGHKGACGMLGTGVLYLRRGLAEDFESPWIGGTGTDSSRLEGPFGWQEAVESGNLNMPAIASLECGVQWVQSGFDEHCKRLEEQKNRVLKILQSSSMFQLIGPPNAADRVPVFSISSKSLAPQELASIFDSSFGIEVRAGLHCAGLIHDNLGTSSVGGTVRISLGHTTTDSDLDRLESAIQSLEQYF
jgi:cysteine desulfurase / selenocysteine lyase